MKRVSDIPAYQSPWLRPEDLQGKTAVVTVESATVEAIRQADGSTEQRIVLEFVGKAKRLILNKTQADAVTKILKTEIFSEWEGLRLGLVQDKARNGKATIAVMPAQLKPAATEEGGHDEQ